MEGKIVVCLINEPFDPNDRDFFLGNELTYYGRWTYKVQQARLRKAAGIVLIHTEESATYPFSVLSNQIEQIRLDQEIPNALKLRIWVTQQAAENILFKSTGKSLSYWIARASSRDFEPVTLDASLTVDIKFQTRRLVGSNVIGILQGSRTDEYVSFSAHHDHLGMQTSVTNGGTDDDSIFNGGFCFQ